MRRVRHSNPPSFQKGHLQTTPLQPGHPPTSSDRKSQYPPPPRHPRNRPPLSHPKLQRLRHDGIRRQRADPHSRQIPRNHRRQPPALAHGEDGGGTTAGRARAREMDLQSRNPAPFCDHPRAIGSDAAVREFPPASGEFCPSTGFLEGCADGGRH